MGLKLRRTAQTSIAGAWVARWYDAYWDSGGIAPRYVGKVKRLRSGGLFAMSAERLCANGWKRVELYQLEEFFRPKWEVKCDGLAVCTTDNDLHAQEWFGVYCEAAEFGVGAARNKAVALLLNGKMVDSFDPVPF